MSFSDAAKENEAKTVQERIQAFMGLQPRKSKVAPKPARKAKKAIGLASRPLYVRFI